MTEIHSSDGAVAVAIRFRTPAPALIDLITSYYIVDVSGPAGSAVADILHPEWGNLRFRLDSVWTVLDMRNQPMEPTECALFGPTSRARHIVARPGSVLGVGFTPLGWALLVGQSAGSAADQVFDATKIIGPELAELHTALCGSPDDSTRCALLDAFFIARIMRQPVRETLIRAIHRNLLDPAIKTVEGFAAATGISQTALARACLKDFGFTSKILLRRQRFLRTLASLSTDEERPIGEVIDSAYVDHSHFNRDFRRFMGMTPSEYLAHPRLMLRAATGQRDRVLGAALQGLHQLRRTPLKAAARPLLPGGAAADRDRTGSDTVL